MRKRLLCLAMALAASLCACTAAQQNPETTGVPSSSSTQTAPTQATTVPATAPTTEPAATTVTVPATTAKPTETNPQETTKPTEPVAQAFLPDQVIAETAREIGKLIPELKFDAAQQTGTSLELAVGNGISHEDAVAEIHDTLLDLFDYNLYLEQQISPEQVQPVIFDYTYSIRYQGLNEDENQHIFEIWYVVNKQSYVSDIFDSDEIIRLVTETVEKSDKVKVTSYENEDYSRVVIYDDIPYFYTTEQASEWLADSVVNEIYGENLGIAKYTRFRLLFHSKGETSYVFLLYLQ